MLSVAWATSAFDASGVLRPFAAGTRVVSVPFTIFTEVGVTDRFSLGAQFGAALNHAAEPGARFTSAGFLDTQVFARGVVVFERQWPEVTVVTQLKVPTGQPSSAPGSLGTSITGSGTADLTVGLDLTRGVRPFVFHADLFFTHAFAVHEGSVEGNALSWSVSWEWPFLPDRLGVMLEVSGRHQVSGAPGQEVVVGAGVELLFSPQVQLLAG